MKIYTRIVFDMNTSDLDVIEEEAFEYEGEIAECGGGGGGKGGLGKSAPKTPSVPEAEPTPSYEEEGEATSAAARDKEARLLRQRRGIAGTVLTSPLGASGDNILGV